MKVKEYAKAVQMFEKKIACDTTAGYRFASHLNAAMSLMQLKQFKEAKEHVVKSIESRPDNVQAWQVLAQANRRRSESGAPRNRDRADGPCVRARRHG